MPDVPRSHLVVYVLAGLAVLWFGVRAVGARSAASGGGTAVAPVQFSGGADGSADGSHGGAVVVDVAGAVRRPGVYRLRAGSRVNDAVRIAGGARPRADLTTVNLAAKLEDGRQVLVPVRTPVGAAPVAGSGSPTAPTAPVNLNTATLEQLDGLTGIGPVTAQQILDYRDAHGGFGSVEELDQVPGIGPATMASLKDAVTV